MATTFTLNYSGQEINNRLARIDDCLAKTTGNIDYLQNENNFRIGNNQSQFVFDTSLGTTGTVLTLSTDSVERTYNGTTTHLDWTNIATKTDAAQTYLAKNVSNWNYGQATSGFELGRSLNDPDLGPVDEYMELEMRSTDDIDATSVGLTQLPTLQLSTTLLNNPNYSDEYDISAYINALGIKTIRGEDGSETINYIPFKNIVNSTNLKTINNVSLIGTGNIEVAADVESITNAEIEALFNEATNHSGSGSN